MKVLIADDESIIRMGLKSMLQELGHIVFAARNGQEALAQAKEYQPDLAILDIRMPGMDGLQVVKELYNIQPLPIIMLTAYSGETLVEKASNLPIQAYLIKPIKSSAELMATIAIATKRFNDQQTEIDKRESAERRLEERQLISQAKIILVQTRHWTEEESHAHIQQLARDEGRTMKAVAYEIIVVNRLEELFFTIHSWPRLKVEQYINAYAHQTDQTLSSAAEELLDIESAKAVLIKRNGLTEKAAANYIQKLAEDSGRRPRDVARAIAKS